MKKQVFVLFCCLSLAAHLAAKDRVIENPAYEFSTSGITHISRIELAKDETRVYIHSVFLPNWWVSFSQKDRIEDPATGQKWYPTAIRNGEFDKHIFMPASGDSTFVLVYPPLGKSVTKINFVVGDEEDPTYIYGISLDPKAKRPDRPDRSAVPAEVQAWIDGELAKAKRKTLLNFEAGEFFVRDTARIVGYIKGYDPRAGFSAGLIYLSNDITREDFPRVARIHPDGRFECSLPMSYPQSMTLFFRNGAGIKGYLQPGTTLSMILDWEEFCTADRRRNISYKFSDIRYQGATASVNRELTAFYAKHDLPTRKIYDEMGKREPDEYKALLKGKYVLVDFWATWCSPCIAAIKQGKDLREKYKDSKDVAFVFITSDKDSPLERYSKLVEEQELAHTYRVTEVEYMYFRQLFAFNGIPHYVLIDREGRVMNQPVHSHNFESTLKKLLEEEGATGEKL